MTTKWTRRDFLGSAAMAGLGATLAATPACVHTRTTKEKPNILFILTDDNSVDEIGYNSDRYLTPRIDRLAEAGVVLDNFHIPSTICTPSRYSFLTGRHAGNNRFSKFHEVWKDKIYCMNWFTNFDPGDRTLGHVLQQAGYRTGYTGKWHNGGLAEEKLKFPELEPDADPADPAVAAALRKRYALECHAIRGFGFDYVDGLSFGNVDFRPLNALRFHNLEWIAKAAMNFLDQTAAERKPFYLQMNLTVPHGPHHVLSIEADQRICAYGYTDENLEGFMPPRSTIAERVKKAGLTAHHDTMGRLWMDDAVGALIDKLQATGQYDNTVIFVISDHGSSGGKGSCYESGIRAPALVHWPAGLKGGRRSDAWMANIDFLPTVAGLCGARLPADMAVDGMDVWARIGQGEADERDDLFLEVGYSRGVKTKQWKYIATRYPEDVLEQMAAGRIEQGWSILGHKKTHYMVSRQHPAYFDQDQLYDLIHDPGETVNLAYDSDYRDILGRMRKRLAQYLAKIPFPFPLERQPYLESNEYKQQAAVWMRDDRMLRETWYREEREIIR